MANNTEADKQIDKIKHYSEQDLNEAKAFFGDGFLEHICFEYSQSFDGERHIKNLLSSATALLPNDARFDEDINKCKSVFNNHFESGIAELSFVVNCCIGKLDT